MDDENQIDEAMNEVPEGDGEQQEQQSDGWLASATPEQQDFARSIGAADDPAKALAAAMGAEMSRRQMQAERDQMRSLIEQQQNGQSQQPEEQEMFGDSPPDFSEIVSAFGGNESAAIDFIAQTRAEQAMKSMRQELISEVQGMVSPVAEYATQNQMRDTAAELATTYGDEYTNLAPEVASFIQQNPELNNPRGMWQAFGMVHAQKQHQQALQRSRQAQADDLGGQGSRNVEQQQADASSAILDAIDSAGGGRRSGYSGI